MAIYRYNKNKNEYIKCGKLFHLILLALHYIHKADRIQHINCTCGTKIYVRRLKLGDRVKCPFCGGTHTLVKWSKH